MPYSRVRASVRWLLLLVLCVAALTGTGAGPTTPATARTTYLKVMSYNVRFASESPPNAWSDRLPLVLDRIRQHRPDLLGVQEPFWPQMRDLSVALPDYGWVGLGRQGGARDEFGAIFYRRDRFDVLDFDHFWLSDTPSVIGSTTWGNAYIRMVTWVKFRDRRTGTVVYHVNTHLDNKSDYARVRSAQLILERVRGFDPGAPVLLTGDFNAAAGASRTYDVLTGPDAFADTWTAAARRGPAYNTLGDWRPPVPDGTRIDWILARGPVRTLWAEIDTYQKDGQYPSDHFPIVANLAIGS